MKHFICIFVLSIWLPAISVAQSLSLENGREAPEGAICTSTVQEGYSEGVAYRVCTHFIRMTSIVDFINGQSTRSTNIEASVATVRQDYKQIFDSQAVEISNLKNSFSSPELQRLIQKAVTEELSKRGL